MQTASQNLHAKELPSGSHAEACDPNREQDENPVDTEELVADVGGGPERDRRFEERASTFPAR